MNELFKMVGIGVIAFLLGAVAALSIGSGLFGIGSGAKISVDELRAAYRQSQGITQQAERQNQELTGKIQKLRNRLERSLETSRELRKQIEGIEADNLSATESVAGIEETNRRFGKLIEAIEKTEY